MRYIPINDGEIILEYLTYFSADVTLLHVDAKSRKYPYIHAKHGPDYDQCSN